jgi:hypothetical protein
MYSSFSRAHLNPKISIVLSSSNHYSDLAQLRISLFFDDQDMRLNSQLHNKFHYSL